jgi:hypothetical protein
MVNNELECTWKAAVGAYEELYRHMLDVTKENHENLRLASIQA